jgi:signal transduction histidine kinase
MPVVDISVNEMVAGQLELLQPMADGFGNRLGLQEDAQLRVRAPAKVVEIIVGNLMRNAINYTRNGSVDVIVTAHSVLVRDSGVGMSADELRKAFEPFYRADESRGRTKGHGLGLAIVKRLVAQFGWQVSARSAPGEGTTIEVRFAR